MSLIALFQLFFVVPNKMQIVFCMILKELFKLDKVDFGTKIKSIQLTLVGRIPWYARER